MWDRKPDTDDSIVYWLLDHSGDMQQFRDAVRQLMELGLLASPEANEKNYCVLFEGDPDYIGLRNSNKSRNNSFMNFFRNWDSKEDPSCSAKKQPVHTDPCRDCSRILKLENQLQSEREDAHRQRVQQEKRIAELEEQLARQKQELIAGFCCREQELLEALRHQEQELNAKFHLREQELMAAVTYPDDDSHKLIASANESRDRAFEMTQQILRESQQFRQAQEQLLMSFKTQVANACNGVGIEKLAELYGRMAHSKTPEVKAHLWSLKNIMTAFGLSSFTPQQGDYFDPRIHEPKIVGDCGSRVTNCYADGWKLGDEIIVRAVVETEDD